MFVDIHAHLDYEDFNSDREKLISEMKDKNIIALSNTICPKNYKDTKKLFKNCDNIKVCPGLYPQEAEKISNKDFKNYLELIKKERKNIVAIGEIGLDRYHSKKESLWKIQESRFRKLIEVGIELDIPLIIHTRNAEKRVLEILREYVEKTNFRKFNLHCFCGKKKLIKEIIDLEIYCSIPLTILNTESFRILVNELPISQILIETDSPFLHPDKVRNSPLNVPLIYKEIAIIKGLDKYEIENIIFSNYMRFTN